MKAIQLVHGDVPVEVHMFFRRKKNNDLTGRDINMLKTGIYPERDNSLIRKPILKIIG